MPSSSFSEGVVELTTVLLLDEDEEVVVVTEVTLV